MKDSTRLKFKLALQQFKTKHRSLFLKHSGTSDQGYHNGLRIRPIKIYKQIQAQEFYMPRGFH